MGARGRGQAAAARRAMPASLLPSPAPQLGAFTPLVGPG